MTVQNIGETAMECLRSLEEYDFERMRALCTETATMWHNDGRGDQSVHEKIEQLRPLVAAVDSLRYDVIRQFQKPDEVLQQQVLHLAMADGSRSDVMATMYFRFKNGLIDRIEESAYQPPDVNNPATNKST